MADIPTHPAVASPPASAPAGQPRGHALHRRHGHHGAHGHKAAHAGAFHSHVAHASGRTPAALPPTAGQALSDAIAQENVPSTWRSSLAFIMARESNGVVGVGNHTDSARGLFQLTRPNYHLNPHGAASFGNATEEAQGGIRYIKQRYQTADNAARFWQQHGWY
ncbi:MAG: hypothetical protein WDN49_03895 [Acetobacteraceae bacterium]